jgi:hypothetical protein
MSRTRTGVLTATLLLLAGALALFLVLYTGRTSEREFTPKFAHGESPADVGESDGESAAETPGEGPAGGWDAYMAAARAYPAKTLSPLLRAQLQTRAKATFLRIGRADARAARRGRGFDDAGHKWKLYGPRQYALQPGVLAFSGATNITASRTTSILVSPDCKRNHCRVWAAVSGGGVWRTDNALADNPNWKQLGAKELDQNSSGQLTLDPSDKKGRTIYYGTGEANRCSSGCEAGVGIYRSRDGGEHWTKLPDICVSNATYACASPGKDAFLGRGISKVVIDPRNKNHIFVGSAQAVRGLSHVIGNGGTTRAEPLANAPGLYESTNGGATFTQVWNGGQAGSFGVTDVGLDPKNLDIVYAAAFDQGLWRRETGPGTTTFSQVFAPQFNTGALAGAGFDRTMFALTVKNNKTRIYLTDGTQNAVFPGNTSPIASNFWRTDNANQPAAALLASQPAGATPPAGNGNPFPATYNGWQKLTAKTYSSPYYASDDFCWAQCWYDERVYSPPGLPDTVYLLGAMYYDELPCNTKGVGCGALPEVSNGRAVLYSTTAGDPDPSANNRTFTDLTYDNQNTPAPWCAFAPYFNNGCVRAPNGIHPDQHAIGINPANPTQIFEGSDGGVIRTSGAFADISAQCSEPTRLGTPNAQGVRQPLAGDEVLTCQRLLSRVPTAVTHVDKKLSSTIQFINVTINPGDSCEVMGGTQDNGTWSNINHCDRNTFHQIIYGDGGNAVYDATEPTWRANEFTSGFGDSNFRNGDPEKWVIATAPVTRSGEGPAFYWPQVGDPNPTPGTHPIYEGAKHVWRSLAFGAGTPTQSGPQTDTTPNVADYEANCPEFVTSGRKLGCGDYRPLGGPYCDGIAATPVPSCINQPGDLTGTVYGADRSGGSMSWIARDSADHGTLWAATSAGRIFVTHNADAADPSTVTWHRIDNATSPTRFPSGIYPDPVDPSHAWISYSGYNFNTPTTPGHAFDVHENGSAPGSGTFVNLNVEGGTSAFPTPTNDGDLPVSDIVRDDATHTLYVSTDFGVLQGPSDGTGGWQVTLGMPRYEVMHLAIQPSSRAPTCTGGGPCKRILYAATHSQGIWQMKLGGIAH